MKKICLIIIISLIPIEFFAQQNDIDLKTEKCLALDNSTAGQRKCINDAEILWDAEMNKYYKLIINKLPDKTKKKLIESQRNWIKFRDTEFEFISEYYFNYKEGTIFYVIADNNKMEIVKKRANELKNYYESLNY